MYAFIQGNPNFFSCVHRVPPHPYPSSLQIDSHPKLTARVDTAATHSIASKMQLKLRPPTRQNSLYLRFFARFYIVQHRARRMKKIIKSLKNLGNFFRETKLTVVGHQVRIMSA